MMLAKKSPMPFCASANQAMRLALKAPEMEAIALMALTMVAMSGRSWRRDPWG